jgi:hypothetical protein
LHTRDTHTHTHIHTHTRVEGSRLSVKGSETSASTSREPRGRNLKGKILHPGSKDLYPGDLFLDSRL